MYLSMHVAPYLLPFKLPTPPGQNGEDIFGGKCSRGGSVAGVDPRSSATGMYIELTKESNR